MAEEQEVYDAVIVGSGPAGLTAAICLARGGLTALVLEGSGIGGQASATWQVENYPGVRACSGLELANVMKEQAEAFGSRFAFARAQALQREKENWRILAGEHTYTARAVVLAMGAAPRKAGFLGEEEYAGRGVSYCAACDGAFFRGRRIFVVGGGMAAVEEGMFLSRIGSRVTLIVRRDRLSCPASAAARLQSRGELQIRFGTKIVEVSGEEAVTRIRFQKVQTGEEWEETDERGYGVFVLAGRQPDTKWLPKELLRDEEGYILTDEDGRTSLPNVYAAGDVRRKKLRQIATAVADGAIAAAELEKQFDL